MVPVCSGRAHSSAAGTGCGAAAQAGRPPQPNGHAAAHAWPALRGTRSCECGVDPLSSCHTLNIHTSTALAL